MDTLKVLGQLAAAATTIEVLYTAPTDVLVTTSTLVVANRTASSITFRVSVHVAGAAADDSQFIFYDVPISGNTTVSVTIGMTLASTDVVKTYASAAGLSFNLFGIETS